MASIESDIEVFPGFGLCFQKFRTFNDHLTLPDEFILQCRNDLIKTKSGKYTNKLAHLEIAHFLSNRVNFENEKMHRVLSLRRATAKLSPLGQFGTINPNFGPIDRNDIVTILNQGRTQLTVFENGLREIVR